MTYLAVCAGAKLRTPTIRPKHCSLSWPLLSWEVLQLLQPTGLSFAQGFAKTSCHLLMCPFAKGSSVWCLLRCKRKEKEREHHMNYNIWVNYYLKQEITPGNRKKISAPIGAELISDSSTEMIRWSNPQFVMWYHLQSIRSSASWVISPVITQRRGSTGT